MTIQRVSSASERVKARPVLLLGAFVLVSAVAAVGIACGADAPSGPPSEVPRQPDGAAILPDGAPNESTSCPLVTESAPCQVPADLTGVQLGSAWATTDEDCKTKLYVAKITNDVTYSLARYTAKSITPSCVLELDTTFEAGEPGDYLAADDSGRVYTVSPKGVVSRIAPLPTVTCASDLEEAASDLTPTAITMLREGTRGYVGFAKLVDGTAAQRQIAKLEPTAEGGCKVTSISLSQPVKGSIDGLAIDTKSRVHVVDHGEKNEDRVAIYLPSGEYVTDYRTGAGAKPLVAVKGITPCRGGLCVEDFGTAVAVDENGVYRAETIWQPGEATSFHVFVGTVRGPFFSVSAVNGEQKILIDLLAEHPAAK